MRHMTRDVNLVRRWAEQHDARPARDDDGSLALAMPDREYTAGAPIEWDAFELLFGQGRMVFVFEDVPGSTFFAIGSLDEVARFAEEGAPGLER